MSQEQKIDRVQVHADNCIGALRHSTDVMITGIWDIPEDGRGISTDWLDLHMSNETAQYLVEKLQEVLDRNGQETDKSDRDRMREQYKP